jgi:hypothetical protein
MADGRARVRVQAEGAVLPAGAALEADFDPATRAPVAVRVCRGGAVECEAALAELGAVEVEGMTMGTWPVIPLRVRARRGRPCGKRDRGLSGPAARGP